MTKKDYVAIAQALMDARPFRPRENSRLDREANEVIDSVARNLTKTMQRDNPRFDRSRFLAACGVQSCNHIPHNPDVMQTVCERCGAEMDLR